MIHFRSGHCCLPRVAVVLVALLLAFAARPAQARQIYVTNFNSGTVGQYDANTGVAIHASLVTGLTNPTGIALDGINHLFVADESTGIVGKYNATTGGPISPSFIAGLGTPTGLALDGNNHLFVAYGGNFGVVGEYDATTGNPIHASFITGLRTPEGLALDGNNHLFVADSNNNRVGEYDATTGLPITNFNAGVNGPTGLALDGANHLFATIFPGSVGQYDATTGTATPANFITGLNNPRGLALDFGNHLFVANSGSNKVGQYDATTGMLISDHFITGLNAPYYIAITPVVPTAQTWTGLAGDGKWNNAGNWNPAVIPNSAITAVTFGNAGAGPVNITSSVLAGSLNFTGVGAGSYTLTSNAGQTLSGLSAINYLNASGNDSGTQTINLAAQAGGNLLYAAGGPLTITNNSINGSLVIGPNTVIGTSGSNGVIFAGVGTTNLSGSFASLSSGHDVVSGVTKTGPGQLTFSGDGTNLFGGLTLNGGTLTLDFRTNAASKVAADPSSALALSGGYLSFLANSPAVSQDFSRTILTANHTEITGIITITGGPPFGHALNMGSLTRSPGATVYFDQSSSLFFNTSAGNTNGLLGTGPAYATISAGMISGGTWAYSDSGGIFGLDDSSYGSSIYTPGTNTDFGGSGHFFSANTTTNSIRFNNNNIFNLLIVSGYTLTLQSGGILMTPNSGPVTIDQGTLTTQGGTGELLVHQYNTINALTITSSIVTSGGLTKTGPGTLILAGNNTGMTGPINVNQGNLTVTNAAAVNSASTINLNDNGGVNSQYLTFQFGNGVNGTISTNIRLGAPTVLTGGQSSHTFAGLNTGTSTNSIVTLSGVISSIPGQATGVALGSGSPPQDITSGFNLTGVNTFVGDVALLAGSLGINSNASLGDPANTLYLSVGSSTAGGLVFLNGGVNLARPVVLFPGAPTRIVSNGSDVNTISGAISGTFAGFLVSNGRFYKAGIGTLILSGTNTYSGGTQIDAGTLSVGADANLGAALGSVSINAGATLGISSSFSTVRSLLIGPTSATAPNGPANISVTAGQTFTPTGGISDNFGPSTLTLTGPGTVVLNTPNTYSGGTVVQQGSLLVGMDSAIGVASSPVTVNAFGTLAFTGSTTTARAFTLNSGTLAVAAGQTLTLNGAAVGGGFLVGPGAFAVTGGTTLTGVTTFSDASIGVTGPAGLANFSNGSSLAVAAGLIAPVNFTRFTNQGSGAITVGAASAVNVSAFQSYGMLTLNPAVAGSGQFTELANTGGSPMYFNGGSRTFIGTPATASASVAGVDLGGHNLVIAGGLFVNNGFVADSIGGGNVIVDYGALYKGAGTNFVPVITQNGGKVQAGNSPGSMGFGRFVFGPGGVNNYVFAIDDATGTAGPSPDALGHVSGWGLVKAVKAQFRATTTSGDFVWTATPTDKLTFALDTLVNPTTVGTDIAGPMDHFDPTSAYSWPAVQWAGTYSGPTDTAMLDAATSFDTSGFLNPVAGTFGWSLGGSSLSLSYTPTPVPEPGTFVLLGLAAASATVRRRMHRKTRRPAGAPA